MKIDPAVPRRRDFTAPLPDDLLRVVVGDAHSDVEGIRTLLTQLGVLDGSGRRQRGFYVIQLGDLVHAGHNETFADRRILEEALEGDWFQETLVGNHELVPAFDLPAGRWHGMTDPPDMRVRELLQQLRRQGGLTAASALDGTLITHAGIHPFYERPLRTEGQTAEELAQVLCSEFEAHVLDQTSRNLFDAVGPARSGGDDTRHGGIFWLDASEMAAASPASTVPQIFGHTPQGPTPLKLGPGLWCADVGAALSGLVCALVKRKDETDWTPYVSRSPTVRGHRLG